MSWGIRIALLYGGFVALILSLVIASAGRKTNLVADDYYQQEIAFQQKLDAAQAGAALQQPLSVRSDDRAVTVQFPDAFRAVPVTAELHFYAPAGAADDRTFRLTTGNGRVTISRRDLGHAGYELQASWRAGGTAYYQAVPLNLR